MSVVKSALFRKKKGMKLSSICVGKNWGENICGQSSSVLSGFLYILLWIGKGEMPKVRGIFPPFGNSLWKAIGRHAEPRRYYCINLHQKKRPKKQSDNLSPYISLKITLSIYIQPSPYS